jgi:protein-S-isoprenylcysteine O-methyltransferase Ste14
VHSREPDRAGVVVGTPARALVVGLIVWRLLDEEDYLDRNLAGYQDYRRKVRWRLVPSLW